MKEAGFYSKNADGTVSCFLCAHNCRIKENGDGICRVRRNENGLLCSSNYGELAAVGVDPVEKKPLFHFLPGTSSYSISCPGCNFRCGFCQNWQISQVKEFNRLAGRSVKTQAQDVVAKALEQGCPSLSYTYTEPVVYYEFAADCARFALSKGLRNVFVTNGYMSQQVLKDAAQWLAAANVDLKSFREDFYSKVCGASLRPVLDTISAMKGNGIWVEVTTLIIPGYNDSLAELKDIARFIAELDRDIPWHVSAFHPDYQFQKEECTNPAILGAARDIGINNGLRFVYAGNLEIENGGNTFCPSCDCLLIERQGFSIVGNKLKDGKCSFCGEKIAGIWE
jgi:pyruvate formate lyase activating enzyme